MFDLFLMNALSIKAQRVKKFQFTMKFKKQVIII